MLLVVANAWPVFTDGNFFSRKTEFCMIPDTKAKIPDQLKALYSSATSGTIRL